MLNREKIIFCICGPTASGKSSVREHIVKRVSSLQFSVSTTTRASRAGERNGEDYFFVSEQEFAKRLEQGKFLEHAQYSGHLYGTEIRNLELAQRNNHDLLLEIEVQGVEQIKKRFAEKVVTLFICPPSLRELEARLRSRATDAEDQIQSRLQIAKQELTTLTSPGFSDYFILNEHLDDALKTIQSVIFAERARFSRLAEESLSAIKGS